jgi:hypothetical protein
VLPVPAEVKSWKERAQECAIAEAAGLMLLYLLLLFLVWPPIGDGL